MKLKVLSLTLILTCVLSGCGFSLGDTEVQIIQKGENNVEQSTEASSEIVEPSEEIKETPAPTETPSNENIDVSSLNKSEKLAYDFIKSIQTSDYETALNYLAIDTTYFTPDDLKWYLQRTVVADIIDVESTILELSSRKEIPENSVKFKLDKAEFSVKTALNNDNEWKIVLNSDAYLENVGIKVPNGSVLNINGKDVDFSNIVGTEENYDLYKFDNVPSKEFPVIVSSSKYGKFEYTSAALSSDKTRTAYCELDETSRDTVINATKDMLNSINDLYETGATKEEFAKYVSDNAIGSVLDILYTSLEEQYSKRNGYTTIEYNIINPNTEKDNVVYLYTDNSIMLNLNIEKLMTDEDGDVDQCRHQDWICIEETEEGLKIVSFDSTNNIIEEANYVKKDW